jgi:hypothetical protein
LELKKIDGQDGQDSKWFSNFTPNTDSYIMGVLFLSVTVPQKLLLSVFILYPVHLFKSKKPFDWKKGGD